MSITAILLISISAFTHAGWNMICKTTKPSAAFFALLTFFSCLLLSPAAFIFSGVFAKLPLEFYILLIVTGFFQTIYYICLANAYRLGEISVAYPMARSIPVVFTPLVTCAFGFGATPSLPAFAGMFAIFCGCTLLPRKRVKDIFNISSYKNAAFALVLAAALFITGYTVIDREALRLIDASGCFKNKYSTAFFYILLENVMIEIFILPYVLALKNERKKFISFFNAPSLGMTFAAAAMCSGGYFLVLFAMQYVENVSYVVAFRQLSLPLGAAMGIIILKESFSPLKTAGLVLIVTGLVLVGIF